MSTIQEIQEAILRLSLDDLANFRRWFEEFDAKEWDLQFENDAASGKLDMVANKAINDFRAGKFKEI